MRTKIISDNKDHFIDRHALRKKGAPLGLVSTRRQFIKATAMITIISTWSPAFNISNANAATYEDDKLFQEAMNLAKEGNAYWKKRNYEKAIPILTKAISLFEKLPKNRRMGNYGSLLTALAGSILHNTLTEHFKFGRTLPNSLDKISNSRDLALQAIDDYEYFASFGDDYKKRIYPMSSGAFNLLGLSSKYLGDLKNARMHFEKSIERNPDNDDAKFNLKHINDNYRAFLK